MWSELLKYESRDAFNLHESARRVTIDKVGCGLGAEAGIPNVYCETLELAFWCWGRAYSYIQGSDVDWVRRCACFGDINMS